MTWHYIKKTKKTTGSKTSIQKAAVLLYVNNELSERKIKEMIPLKISLKKKIPRNKFNQGDKRPIQWKL